MELHQLRYFVAVAQLENFTRAAQKCFVAQPSLSQQIIKLEREFGGPLFDRTGRKVRLTDRGRTLFDRAIEILAVLLLCSLCSASWRFCLRGLRDAFRFR